MRALRVMLRHLEDEEPVILLPPVVPRVDEAIFLPLVLQLPGTPPQQVSLVSEEPVSAFLLPLPTLLQQSLVWGPPILQFAPAVL